MLPRNLIKRDFHLLGTVYQPASLTLDGMISPGALGSSITCSAACITVGEHPPFWCSSASLLYMDSLLALNEQLKMCAEHRSWNQALRKTTALFPSDLDFFTSARVSASAAANCVLSACEHRRVGDSVW